MKSAPIFLFADVHILSHMTGKKRKEMIKKMTPQNTIFFSDFSSTDYLAPRLHNVFLPFIQVCDILEQEP